MMVCALICLVSTSASPVQGRQRGKNTRGTAASGSKPSGSGAGKTNKQAGAIGPGASKAIMLLEHARAIAHRSPHKYGGHRKRALVHIDHAIRQLHESAPSSSGSTSAKGKGKGNAKGKGTSSSHSQHAVTQMDEAIKQLRAGIAFFRTAHPKQKETHLTHAEKLVQKARQSARK
jgi:hypothetical protein